MTSCDYSAHILLQDVTKAFDTINRENLYEPLSEFLDPDELSVIYILLKDVTLQVKNNKNKRTIFYNNYWNYTRRQSQCNFFTLYLSNDLSAKVPTQLHDHNYHNANDMFLTPTDHLHYNNCCTKHDKNSITDLLTSNMQMALGLSATTKIS